MVKSVDTVKGMNQLQLMRRRRNRMKGRWFLFGREGVALPLEGILNYLQEVSRAKVKGAKDK